MAAFDARECEHLLGHVECEHSGCTGAGEVQRELAGAAAEIEYA